MPLPAPNLCPPCNTIGLSRVALSVTDPAWMQRKAGENDIAPRDRFKEGSGFAGVDASAGDFNTHPIVAP